MPSIIFKKTFKMRPSGFKVGEAKVFSFHGNVPKEVIDSVNQNLGLIQLQKDANKAYFEIDETGHYTTKINHNFQKYHEEDAIVVVLDEMEKHGYTFKFEYDQEIHSVKFSGDSYTKREVFIFHKPVPGVVANEKLHSLNLS